MIVDTRINGKTLPELPGKKIIIRINRSTLILPRLEKVRNEHEYIDNFNERINKDRKRHG